MRTPPGLATYVDHRRAVATRREAVGPCGFTLIELLVVVMIIGVIAGLTVINAGRQGPAELLETEARRLQALFRLAGEEAILFDRLHGLQLARQDYRFVVLDQAQWRAVDGEVLRRRVLPPGVELGLRVDEQDVDLPRSIDASREPAAHVAILPSGEVTPFSLRLAYEGLAVHYLLEGSPYGSPTIRGPLAGP